MSKRTDRYFRNHLWKYFDNHYGTYEDSIEFYVDPAINIWKFYIPELNLIVTLTCGDDGQIVENKELKNNEHL